MSVLINPFDAAGFSLAEMTQAIQLVPNQYGRLNRHRLLASASFYHALHLGKIDNQPALS